MKELILAYQGEMTLKGLNRGKFEARLAKTIRWRLEPLAALYPTPAYCDEKIWIFTAKDLTPGHTHPDEDEFITAEWVPLAEAERMVLAGEIEDAKTQIAILKYTALRRKGELHE